MDYSFIIKQIQTLLNNNWLSLLPIFLIVINLLIFIISKTFRKTGIFVLALAFGIDYGIKALPIDLYYTIPWLYNAVTILYILGFIIFFFKIFKMLVRIGSADRQDSFSKKSKLSQFLKFTGIIPFFIMILVNIIDANKALPQDIVGLITSITFLIMVVRTIISTYKFLSTKESIVLGEKLDFEEIKNYLRDDQKPNKSNSKNQGRVVRRTIDRDIVIEPTEKIDVRKITDTPIKVSSIDKETNRNPEDLSKKPINKLSNTDIIQMISNKDDDNKNITSIKITNLSTSQETSYSSNKANFSIKEEDEYQVDLDFDEINDYDYGRFIDILLTYSKDKKSYKFQLEVSPSKSPFSKIILYDPSNIYDIDDKDYINASGKTISMNFPKYKINFITGN